MLTKEIKGDPNKWKNILWTWFGRLSIVNMSVLPKLAINLRNINQNTSRIFCIDYTCCVAIEKLILKFMWKRKGIRRAKIFLQKKNKVGTLWDKISRTYHKATVIKAIWNWQGGRHMDQWEKIESRNRRIQIWLLDIWQKRSTKVIQCRKDSLFNFNKWFWFWNS